LSSRERLRSLDSEGSRDVQDALDTVPLISFTTFDHTATGTVTDYATLSWGIRSDKLARNATSPPLAALVVRVVDTTDESGNPGNFRPALNFEFVSSSTGDHTVRLYEPEGLTANTKYRITVMMVG
jgi:hypothetical protein